MGTTAGVGYSVRRNPAEAGREAALKAKQQAWTEAPDFVFVFATIGYNQQVLYTINKRSDVTSAFERLFGRRNNNSGDCRRDQFWRLRDGDQIG